MADQTLVPDGTTNFSGGQNAAVDPNLIKDNQYYIGINVSANSGSLTPRWGFIQQKIIFTDTEEYTRQSGVKVSFEYIFYSGKFQAFFPYGIGPDHYVLYVVSGFVYLINTETLEAKVLNKTDSLDVHLDRVNISNAGNYLVICDYNNYPFILDGVQIRRADPALDEVPICSIAAYNQNRLCISNYGIDWTAGDPAGSQSAPNAPVTFIEVLQPSTGFTGDVYQIPTAATNTDRITAMGFLQVLDKSTEIGPLLLATVNAIYSARTDLPRLQWVNGVFTSVLLYSTGMPGQRSQVNVGSDLIFKGNDRQVYDLTMSRNDQYKWSNSPISREVNIFLEAGDPALDYITATANYRNKIFITCYPYRVNCYSSEGVLQTDYVNRGFVVIETDNMSTLGEDKPPAWAGMWTGLEFLDFAESGKVMYCAAKHLGKNHLFIVDPSKTYDVIDDKIRYVESTVFTKEYDNTDGTVNKAIHSVDLGLRSIEEKLKVTVDYKTSTSELFHHWRDLEYNAPVEQCEAYPKFPQGLTRQGIRDLNLGGVNQNVCDEPAREFTYVYKALQLRIKLTGKYWKFEYVKLKGKVLPQTDIDPYCKKKDPVPVPAQCYSYWDLPKTTKCET